MREENVGGGVLRCGSAGAAALRAGPELELRQAGPELELELGARAAQAQAQRRSSESEPPTGVRGGRSAYSVTLFCTRFNRVGYRFRGGVGVGGTFF